MSLIGCCKVETLKIEDMKKIIEVKSYSDKPSPLTLPSLKWLNEKEIIFIKEGEIWKTNMEGISSKVIDLKSLTYPVKEEIGNKKNIIYYYGEKIEIPFVKGNESFVSIAPSLDGKRIVFSANVFNMRGRTDRVIGRIDIDGKNFMLFRNQNSIMPWEGEYYPTDAPSWSPDGKDIAFHKCEWNLKTKGNVEYGIWIMDEEGKNSKPFLPPGDYTYPIWSYDGKYLLYKKYIHSDFREEGEIFTNCNIEMIEIDSKKKVFSYSPNEPVIGPSVLSPDGKWIAYTSNDTLWAIRTKNGASAISLLSYETGRIRSAPAWSLDGKRIAVVMQTKDYPNDNLWVLTVIK